MGRLTVQSAEAWTPFTDPWSIAVLDRSMSELAEPFGWRWEEYEEDGLGLVSGLPLAWDGKSRFFLSGDPAHPEKGVDVEVSESEDHAAARADLLAELGLTPQAFLAVSEGGVWFARWDEQYHGRPATAAPREDQ